MKLKQLKNRTMKTTALLPLFLLLVSFTPKPPKNKGVLIYKSEKGMVTMDKDFLKVDFYTKNYVLCFWKHNFPYFFLAIEGFEVNLFIVNALFIVTALNPGQIQLKKNCSDAAANRG